MKKVFVAGHRGLVGSAILRRLQAELSVEVLTVGREVVDLRNQTEVDQWFQSNRPEEVYLVAGTVGGILANATRPAEFLYDNMMIHANVIEAARRSDVTKLLYLGSSCIYPRDARQPIKEDELLAGLLEPTNEWYAIAKIAGIKMCQAYRRQYGSNFISAMPTNLYGPGDNFDLRTSHVLPALIRKFDESRRTSDKVVRAWGSGVARREFLHVDDLADACVFLMQCYDGDAHVNVGTGVDVSIRELAEKIRAVVSPESRLEWDATKPDGTPRKVLDVSKINKLGWKAKISLDEGIVETYEWFRDQTEQNRDVRGWVAPVSTSSRV